MVLQAHQKTYHLLFEKILITTEIKTILLFLINNYIPRENIITYVITLLTKNYYPVL